MPSQAITSFGACPSEPAYVYVLSLHFWPPLVPNTSHENLLSHSAWEGFLSWPGKSSFMLAFLQLTFRSNFSVLVGPINHIKYLVSKERLAFPVVYFSSLARGKHHLMFPNLGSLLEGIVQVVALVASVLAYFLGGTQTLRFGAQKRHAGQPSPI
ncbi:hypothetical protein V8E55_009582 [Tylopilus felleus]